MSAGAAAAEVAPGRVSLEVLSEYSMGRHGLVSPSDDASRELREGHWTLGFRGGSPCESGMRGCALRRCFGSDRMIPGGKCSRRGRFAHVADGRWPAGRVFLVDRAKGTVASKGGLPLPAFPKGAKIRKCQGINLSSHCIYRSDHQQRI